jgi:threonine dehydratase
VKIKKARAQSANVILYDRQTEHREEIAVRIANKPPVRIVPSGDNPFVIAGQGTATGEALQALSGTNVDIVVVPCGGGGLAAGTCLAVEAFRSKAQVWAVEPAGFDDTRRSLASGQREKNPLLDGSICDALLALTRQSFLLQLIDSGCPVR